MLKKRELLEFLDRVEHKAVNSVEERWQKKIEAAKEEAIKQYVPKINLYQDALNRLASNLNELIHEMHENQEVAYNFESYYGINYYLNQLTQEPLLNRIRGNSKFHGQVSKLVNKKDKEIKEVKDNYHKVKMVCISMDSGKKVAEYLKGLGFDLSSLEKEESTALVADIDKKKLFVCGEHK